MYCRTHDVPSGVINNQKFSKPKSPEFGEATPDDASETATEGPAIRYALEGDQMTQAVFIEAANDETEVKKENSRIKDPLAFYRTQKAPFNYVVKEPWVKCLLLPGSISIHMRATFFVLPSNRSTMYSSIY